MAGGSGSAAVEQGGLEDDGLLDDEPRHAGRRHGLLAGAMAALALVGIAASGYLTWTKLSGELPVCGPIAGCETVQQSQYSAVLGIPVSVFGLGMAIVVLASVVGWWVGGDRRALYLPYLAGLMGVFVVAYLAYLMLFVIRAVCVWCSVFDTTVVLGWILSIVALRVSASD